MTEQLLPDWAYTDEELHNIAKEKLVYDWSKIDTTLKDIVAMRLISKNGDTGKCMLVWTDSSVLTSKYIDRLWSDVGVTSLQGETVTDISQSEYEGLLKYLARYKYTPKYDLPGSELVYEYDRVKSVIRDS